MNPNNFVAILGWIGCEYKPAGVTEDGLDWVKPYLEEGEAFKIWQF